MASAPAARQQKSLAERARAAADASIVEDGLTIEARRLGCHGASQILPGLFVGSEDVAKDIDALRNHGITVIINCAKELANFQEPLGVFEYHNLELEDAPADTPALERLLPRTLDLVAAALESEKRVLVHCTYGRSRSGAVAVAHVMKTQRLTAADALEIVKSKRAVVQPNSGFMGLLQTLDAKAWSPQGGMCELPRRTPARETPSLVPPPLPSDLPRRRSSAQPMPPAPPVPPAPPPAPPMRPPPVPGASLTPPFASSNSTPTVASRGASAKPKGRRRTSLPWQRKRPEGLAGIKDQQEYKEQKQKLLSSRTWAVESEPELQRIEGVLERAEKEGAREEKARAQEELIENLKGQKDELIRDQLATLKREQQLRRREFHQHAAAPWTELEREDGSPRLEVWEHGISDVRVPGQGATNPVFFVLLEKQTARGIVIFKFLKPGQSGRVFLGDRLLRQMGASTPSLRFVRSGDDELTAIQRAAQKFKDASDRQNGVLEQQVFGWLPQVSRDCSADVALFHTLEQLRDGSSSGETKWESLMVMEYCKGQMVDDFLQSVKADDKTAMAGVGKLFRQLGEMLVCDLLTHNYDRFFLPGIFDRHEGHRDEVRNTPPSDVYLHASVFSRSIVRLLSACLLDRTLSVLTSYLLVFRTAPSPTRAMFSSPSHPMSGPSRSTTSCMSVTTKAQRITRPMTSSSRAWPPS